MRQPEGFKDPRFPNFVWLLLRALYGLKQAGRAWWKTLRKWLFSLDFKPLNSEATAYIRFRQGKVIIILWHVDDGLCASTPGHMDDFIKEISGGPWTITDLGEPSHLLGCKITRNRENGTIKLSMHSYIHNIISRFGFQNLTSIGSPLDPNIKISRRSSDSPDPSMSNIPYAEAIGSINWAAEACRPDIAFARTKLAQYIQNPSWEHWSQVIRVFRYLSGTAEIGIVFRRDGTGLRSYSDSDWAQDLDDRKSITGFLLVVAGAPISWKSRKQRNVSLSSMEAEYNATMEAAREILWTRKILLFLSNFLPMTISTTPHFTDSLTSISFIKNDVEHDRTKHIDTHFHFLRDQVESKAISVHHIPGLENPADILTKALSPAVHRRAMDLLGLVA